MPFDNWNIPIGTGTILTGIGLLKYLRRNRTPPKPMSEKDGWHSVLAGIAEIQLFMARVETFMRGFPPLQETVSRHDQELARIRLDCRSIRDELGDMRREGEEQQAKLIRLAREFREDGRGD